MWRIRNFTLVKHHLTCQSKRESLCKGRLIQENLLVNLEQLVELKLRCLSSRSKRNKHKMLLCPKIWILPNRASLIYCNSLEPDALRWVRSSNRGSPIKSLWKIMYLKFIIIRLKRLKVPLSSPNLAKMGKNCFKVIQKKGKKIQLKKSRFQSKANQIL